MTTRWLNRRVGPFGPYMALCLSESEFQEAIKRLKVNCPDEWICHARARCHAFNSPTGDLCCIVCLGKVADLKPTEIAAVLVHEAVHIWQYHAADIGEKTPGDEQEAYAIQFISGILMAEYARRVA